MNIMNGIQISFVIGFNVSIVTSLPVLPHSFRPYQLPSTPQYPTPPATPALTTKKSLTPPCFYNLWAKSCRILFFMSPVPFTSDFLFNWSASLISVQLFLFISVFHNLCKFVFLSFLLNPHNNYLPRPVSCSALVLFFDFRIYSVFAVYQFFSFFFVWLQYFF